MTIISSWWYLSFTSPLNTLSNLQQSPWSWTRLLDPPCSSTAPSHPLISNVLVMDDPRTPTRGRLNPPELACNPLELRPHRIVFMIHLLVRGYGAFGDGDGARS